MSELFFSEVQTLLLKYVNQVVGTMCLCCWQASVLALTLCGDQLKVVSNFMCRRTLIRTAGGVGQLITLLTAKARAAFASQ